MLWHKFNDKKVPVRILETHEKDYTVENTETHSRYRVLKSFVHDDGLNPEDTVAVRVEAAIGMLVTDDEMMARRGLTFLRGRYSLQDLGWFYKEGYYNIVIIGTPADYAADENHFHQVKQLLDATIHTDLKASAQLQLSVFQEVAL